ncbi:putative fasciclin-like arabinogalactan protein 20 [Mercurialis annua]|uniref:putative fasciclin-like arabinogalactan protein 20 n=1 Tax=Mercurialis annua TaxID=3986 RepID=UPI002160EB42|nr:putative fasciclin-like arabinogalactan protein 20 [Mercurialis annua]
MATKSLIFLTLISLFHLSTSTSAPTNTVLDDAVIILSDSGFNSMALTLEFGARTIVPPPLPDSLTIFCPSDAVFTYSGQPSLNLLRFHLSPFSISFNSLKSLPYGSKIPSFWANHSLVVTSNSNTVDEVEVNGVKINGFSAYDDGSLVIFGIDKFLDPNFQILPSITPPSPPPPSSPPPPLSSPPYHHILNCSNLDIDDDGHIDSKHSLQEASEALRSRGYFLMASFLDLQLTSEFRDDIRLTILAPTDESLKGILGSNISEFKSIFLRHFLVCKVPLADLGRVGARFHTFLDGFMVNVKTDEGNNVTVNGVEVKDSEIYENDWLVVLGLDGSLFAEEIPQENPDVPSDGPRTNCAYAFNDCRFCTIFCSLVILILINFDNVMGWMLCVILVVYSRCATTTDMPDDKSSKK